MKGLDLESLLINICSDSYDFIQCLYNQAIQYNTYKMNSMFCFAIGLVFVVIYMIYELRKYKSSVIVSVAFLIMITLNLICIIICCVEAMEIHNMLNNTPDLLVIRTILGK